MRRGFDPRPVSHSGSLATTEKQRTFNPHTEGSIPSRPTNMRRESNNNKTNRKRRRDRLIALKRGKPCVDCNEVYPHYVMDFDHVRGEKLKNLSKLVNSTYTWRLVESEIEKCDLVCSNCHRIRTWNRLVGASSNGKTGP